MAEITPAGRDVPTEADVPALQLLAPDRTAGFCDPVSGVCVLPEADTEDGPVETGSDP